MLAGESAVSPVSRVQRMRAHPVLEMLHARAYALAVAAMTAGLGAFLLARIEEWPPHEDETLVLFVSRQPLADMFGTVISERGGAPLHFLLAHLVATLSSGLTGLRLISVVFAVASVPVVAALVAKLTDRRTALVATALVAASWMTIYHGLYGRMYGLFLFTSALSFLLLLHALDGRRRTWALWAVVSLAAIATQPYGALVVGVQAVYVALRWWRRRFDLRPGAVAFAAVALVALPLWLTYRVLASRFEVGIIGEGDFTAGWNIVTALVAVGAAIGLVALVRAKPQAALLSVLVLVLPALALMAVRSGSSLGLESRHLIFVLPFFALLVAAGLVRITALAGRAAPVALALAVVALAAGEIAWGWHKTPALYAGENPLRTRAREAASAWLAVTSRSDDVLLGYEPLYLDAANRGARFGQVLVPRADPRLMLDTLEDAERPLGRGVWVFDATDEQDPAKRRYTIPARSPGDGFEARAYGPFLVIRTTEPVGTPERFVRLTIDVERLGSQLRIGDAGLNLSTALEALRRLEAR
jgi:hypothetical protein